ncbi:MAG: Gfo/Idh/MocA family oxidoreductase [Spirochaetaceae bacterium]|jgi:predicted dehydrogenase|nr:Gfo/Idh/MocA family oxidoreductase [Spirochaetaceae bacterium]
MGKKRIGVIGAGKISGIYLQNLMGMFGQEVILTGITDLVEERARQAAEAYHLHCFKNAQELIACAEVDIVLNLTQPQHHYAVALAAVQGGKPVYNEKPLCVSREEAATLLGAAQEQQVRVGCAPDTFLGSGLQTCRALIDEGAIGRPIAAVAFMMNHGHEHWHPDPAFYYKTGGGPLFDMGPYYLTALVNLLGPIARVSGSAQQGFKTRTITSEPLKGETITVEVPTHVVGVLDFVSGAVGTIITSFDVYAHSLPFIEIYGTAGALKAPDPNTFGGPVMIRRAGEETWSEVPLLSGFPENSRGLGLTDMAQAFSENRPHRASGELAFHVLEVMQGIHEASASGRYYLVQSVCSRPELLAP